MSSSSLDRRVEALSSSPTGTKNHRQALFTAPPLATPPQPWPSSPPSSALRAAHQASHRLRPRACSRGRRRGHRAVCRPLADAMPSNHRAAGRGFHEKILIKTGAFASREGTARSSKRFFPSILAEVAGGGVGLSAPDDPVPAGSVPASTRPRFTRHPATSPPSPARTPEPRLTPTPLPRAQIFTARSPPLLSRKASVASFQSDADAQENDPNYQGPKPDIKIGNMVWEDHYDIMGPGASVTSPTPRRSEWRTEPGRLSRFIRINPSSRRTPPRKRRSAWTTGSRGSTPRTSSSTTRRSAACTIPWTRLPRSCR